jgi:hypothetical protein
VTKTFCGGVGSGIGPSLSPGRELDREQ